MTEQVPGIVSAEVDPVTRRIGETGILGAETSGASPKQPKTKWSVQGALEQVHIIEGPRKILTEQLNEAYDEEAGREDEEFLRNTKAYYRRRRRAEEMGGGGI